MDQFSFSLNQDMTTENKHKKFKIQSTNYLYDVHIMSRIVCNLLNVGLNTLFYDFMLAT